MEIGNLAQRRLCTQASSATSERSFSRSGLVVTKQRMALAPKHVDGLSTVAWDLIDSGWGPGALDKEKRPVGAALVAHQKREQAI